MDIDGLDGVEMVPVDKTKNGRGFFVSVLEGKYYYYSGTSVNELNRSWTLVATRIGREPKQFLPLKLM